MSYTDMADQIIDLVEQLGYGIDIDFSGRKPIMICIPKAPIKKFQKFEDALKFLQLRMTAR